MPGNANLAAVQACFALVGDGKTFMFRDMNISIRSLVLTFTLAAASLFVAATAHAQTGTPQSPYVITSAPYTVTRSGYYILGNNLNYTGTSGNIITINASNVTLDFNGFYIAGAVGNTGQTTYGVRANEQSNVTVKNGTIAYCYIGIFIIGNNTATTNAVGETIDNMRLTYCYYEGIEMDYCPASTITNCKNLPDRLQRGKLRVCHLLLRLGPDDPEQHDQHRHGVHRLRHRRRRLFLAPEHGLGCLLRRRRRQIPGQPDAQLHGPPTAAAPTRAATTERAQCPAPSASL